MCPPSVLTKACCHPRNATSTIKMPARQNFFLTAPEPRATLAAMKLIEYLQTNGITYRAFGAQIGRDQAEVWRWANGRRVPPLLVANQIEQVTDGKVTPRTFVESGT